MRGTRRYWEAVSTGAVLAGGALLFGRPLLLAGAAGVWVWLLVRQYRFAAEWRRLVDGVEIDQVVDESTPTVGEPVTVRVDCTLPDGVPADVRVESVPPLAADAPGPDGRTLAFGPDGSRGQVAYALSIPVVGRTRLRGATVRARDRAGLFAARVDLARDDRLAPAVDVRPGPADVHVGAGGAELPRGLGEHDTQHGESGVEPLEIRQYRPGDSLRRIDWNATARLAEPHVRVFESTTNRQTLLLLDHGRATAAGAAGRTVLDHGLAVARAVVASARRSTDPLGWVTVADRGVTGFVPPRSGRAQYDRARRAIESLAPAAGADDRADATRDPTNATGEPTDGTEEGPTNDAGERAPGASGDTTGPAVPRRSTDDDGGGRPADGRAARNGRSRAEDRRGRFTTADRRRIAARLSDDDSAFATTLRPFFADPTPSVRRRTDTPLFDGVRTALRRLDGVTWTVVVTDDGRPVELLETVRRARRNGNRVLVFLAPAVLFDPGDPDDLEAAYERYREFERLRARLDGHERVSAFEVGPRDGVAAILGRRGRRRGDRGTRRSGGTVESP